MVNIKNIVGGIVVSTVVAGGIYVAISEQLIIKERTLQQIEETERTPQQIEETERITQEIFGSRKKAGRMIFNTMNSPTIKQKGRDWELIGSNFNLVLKEYADEGWEYIDGEHTLGFVSEGMSYDGNKVKTKADKVKGKVEKSAFRYSNSLGKGIDIKINQTEDSFKKIIEIESLESLNIPVDAEYLEFSFKLTGNIELPQGVIERTKFGNNSYINPIRAWDSQISDEEVTESGTYGKISGTTLTKYIPVEWLRTATFPVFTDTNITFGAESTFGAKPSTYTAVDWLDSTHIIVVYIDDVGSDHPQARVGVVSGTTITSWGTEKELRAQGSWYLDVVALNNTRFIASFDETSGSDRGIITYGTVSGTTITIQDLDSWTQSPSRYSRIAKLDSSRYVIHWWDNSATGDAAYIIGKVTSSSNSFGSKKTITGTNATFGAIGALTSSSFVSSYRDSSFSQYTRIVVGTVNDTTITLGTPSTAFAVDTEFTSLTVLDSTHFVVGRIDDATDDYYAKVGTVSGTTITGYGNQVAIHTGSTSYPDMATIDSSTYVAVYKDNVGSFGKSRLGFVSGTTISQTESEQTFNANYTYFPSVAVLNGSQIAIVFKDGGASNYGKAMIGDYTAVVGPATITTINTIDATTLSKASSISYETIKSISTVE